MTLMHLIIKNAEHVFIALAITGTQIEQERGKAYLNTITTLQRIVSTTGIENSKTTLIPIINRPDDCFKSPKSMEAKMKQIIDIMQQKIDAIKMN